jgi:preprotein translocase subunit SecE
MLREMFQAGFYKRNQGRTTRQATFAVLAIVTCVAAWRLFEAISGWSLPESLEKVQAARFAIHYGLPGLAFLVGVWVSYRAVNLPKFADFLIAVEAEMNKVSWPDRPTLVRSSMVVIFTIVFLAAALFLYDLLWIFLLGQIGIGGN